MQPRFSGSEGAETSYDVISEELEGDLEFGQYLAAVIHELRNPLNGILGAAQLIADVPLDQETSENVQMILTTAESMDLILNDLMDFACIKSGVFQVAAKSFAIRPAIEEVWKFLAPQASEKGISFRTVIDPAIPELVIADRSRLRQIVLNLASNAIKFTPNGEVTIGLSWLPAMSPPKARLIVTVEDTGVGISSECLKYVFRPFCRGAQTNETSSGHGLGLFVVGRLVTAMGGTISLKSVEGSGTTVAVNLPCQKNLGGN